MSHTLPAHKVMNMYEILTSWIHASGFWMGLEVGWRETNYWVNMTGEINPFISYPEIPSLQIITM